MLRAVRPEASIGTVDALKLCCDLGVAPIRRRDQQTAFGTWLLTAPGCQRGGGGSKFLSARATYNAEDESGDAHRFAPSW